MIASSWRARDSQPCLAQDGSAQDIPLDAALGPDEGKNTLISETRPTLKNTPTPLFLSDSEVVAKDVFHSKVFTQQYIQLCGKKQNGAVDKKD